MSRSILLCDANSFFASVHQAMDPALRGKPVIVGGDPAKRTGIVLAASYEAKRYGVKTGMLVSEARALCPQGTFVSPSMRDYTAFSTRINNIYKQYSDLTEAYSIDESFLDVTYVTGLFGPSLEIAQQIQQRVRSEIGVGINIGIGPSKLVAKMAAELEKPNKIIPLSLEEWPQRIWPLPVQELFGVGHRIGGWLRSYAVNTIGELAALPVERLTRRYGVIGEILYYSANGLDFSPVDPNVMDVVKSVGHQITLPRDYRGYDPVKVVILELAEEVSYRARKSGLAGRTVGLGLKDPLFNTLYRTKALYNYTDITNEVYEAGVQLLTKHWPKDLMVRAVGLCLSGLVPNSEKQLEFFTQRGKLEQLDRATDHIRSRWGKQSIKRAISLTGLGVFRNER